MILGFVSRKERKGMPQETSALNKIPKTSADFITPAKVATALSAVWLILLWGLVARFSLQAVLNRLHHLQSMEPNEIGDFLAGAFAPIALVWLVATVWLQQKGLRESREQFQATEANAFKLALFERRLKVKEQFETGAHQLMQDDEVQRKGILVLWEAASTAEYIFGSSIRTTLRELLDKAHRARFYDLEYDRLQKKRKLTGAETASLQEAIDGRYEIAMWIIDAASPHRLAEMFRPYLEMPQPTPAGK
jgi:hypothetical protein